MKKETFEELVAKGDKLGKDLSRQSKDILEINKELKKNKVNASSIIARAKNSVLQFPVYVTNSGIRANEAHLISKLLERVYASYVQYVLSLYKVKSAEELEDLSFLKDIHVNIKESAATIYHNKYYKPIDTLDQIIQESVFNSIETEDGIVEFKEVVIRDKNFIAENARLLNEPLTGFIFEADNREKKASKYGNFKKSNMDTTETYDVPEKELTSEDIAKIATDKEVSTDSLKNDIKKSNGLEVELNNKKVKVFHKTDKASDGSDVDVFYIPGKKISKRVSVNEEVPRTPMKVAEILRDTDIKKINGMLPYGIKCTFRLAGGGGDMEYLIGVKSVLHLVDMKELANDIRNILEGEMKNIRKIKYKTGELSFLDYWFNISGIKADAAKRLNPNSRWLSTLKRLADATKVHGTYLKNPMKMVHGNIPHPIATLVISKNEVDSMASKTGVNIEDIRIAKKLMSRLFLICIIIVDGSAGVMKVLMTDDAAWDNQAISQLDADLSKLDNSSAVKELGKLIHNFRG